MVLLACFIIRIKSHDQRVTLESIDSFLRGYTLLVVFIHSITKGSSYQFVTQRFMYNVYTVCCEKNGA